MNKDELLTLFLDAFEKGRRNEEFTFNYEGEGDVELNDKLEEEYNRGKQRNWNPPNATSVLVFSLKKKYSS